MQKSFFYGLSSFKRTNLSKLVLMIPVRIAYSENNSCCIFFHTLLAKCIAFTATILHPKQPNHAHEDWSHLGIGGVHLRQACEGGHDQLLQLRVLALERFRLGSRVQYILLGLQERRAKACHLSKGRLGGKLMLKSWQDIE